MIDFYYWPTPNGWKVSIMLEECGIDYRMIPLNISEGEQFNPKFLRISPNNRMPAIVDTEPTENYNKRSVTVFESGCILLYLAKKVGKFLPNDPMGEKEMFEWLFWQVGNLGPMAGQASHFINYAEGENAYAKLRYDNEYNRCIGVLERRLAKSEWLAGNDYSICDIASWPWVLISKPLGQKLDDFPNVARWRNKIKERPAVRRGVDLGKELRRSAPPTEKERKLLYHQTAQSATKMEKTFLVKGKTRSSLQHKK